MIEHMIVAVMTIEVYMNKNPTMSAPMCHLVREGVVRFMYAKSIDDIGVYLPPKGLEELNMFVEDTIKDILTKVNDMVESSVCLTADLLHDVISDDGDIAEPDLSAAEGLRLMDTTTRSYTRRVIRNGEFNHLHARGMSRDTIWALKNYVIVQLEKILIQAINLMHTDRKERSERRRKKRPIRYVYLSQEIVLAAIDIMNEKLGEDGEIGDMGDASVDERKHGVGDASVDEHKHDMHYPEAMSNDEEGGADPGAVDRDVDKDGDGGDRPDHEAVYSNVDEDDGDESEDSGMSKDGDDDDGSEAVDRLLSSLYY